jgi:hypothetical protein
MHGHIMLCREFQAMSGAPVKKLPASILPACDGSPLFIPVLTLTWLCPALKRVLYFASDSCSLLRSGED